MTKTEMLEQFWLEYPRRDGRKIGRGKCLAWFNKNVRDDDMFNLIMKGLNVENRLRGQAQGHNRFFPAPCDPIRFLKEKRYEDYTDEDVDSLFPEEPTRTESFKDEYSQHRAEETK